VALAWHNQRERAKAGLTAARARGRRGGRPKALTGKKLSIAQDLYNSPHNSPQNFIAEICQTLKVSKATLYRHIQTGDRDQ
jgi:DNA invertase Pin-like site-specific DNA recombinase